jgi:hypothetical protein
LENAIILFSWNNSSDFLGINSEAIQLNIGSKIYQIPLSNLVVAKLDSKKKLAPLIAGGVLTSLALVNILLEGAGLSMIGLLSFGLLVLYFGLSDYWVLNIEQFNKSSSIWISKNKCSVFPQTLINIIMHKISKGVFPPFYAHVKKEWLHHAMSNSYTPEKSNDPISYYLVPPMPNPDYVLIKVDISKLKASIKFVINEAHLAESHYKINNEALMNLEE